MSNSEQKLYITQEALDEALKAKPHLELNLAPSEDPTAEPAKMNLWNLESAKAPLLGIHIRAASTYVALLDLNFELKMTAIIRQGYEQIDALFKELDEVLKKNNIGASPTIITLSGKHSHFVISKMPNMPKQAMTKALKLQIKQMIKEERDDINFLRMSGDNDTLAGDYLAAAVTTPIADKVLEGARKLKLKINAWDVDILCYARAASLLWQKKGMETGTRFAIVLGGNFCRLIILSEDRKIIVPVIPIGIKSFTEHLGIILNEVALSPLWLEEKKLTITANDTRTVIQQKLLAHQTIFSLYIPFSQQVKMQLYAACQEYGIEVPSHFTLLGPGSNLYRIVDCLEEDLEMSALPFSELSDPEFACAIGASLGDKHPVKVNCLPKGNNESLQAIKDAFFNLKEQLGKKMPKSKSTSMPGFTSGVNPIKLGLGALAAIILLAIYPIYHRSQVQKELARRQATMSSLGSSKDKILEFSARKTLLEKRILAKKLLIDKRCKTKAIMTELLFSLPPEIRLSYFSVRETVVTVKGAAKSQDDFEKYLETASQYKLMIDPQPLNIRRDGNLTTFEITLKVKSG